MVRYLYPRLLGGKIHRGEYPATEIATPLGITTANYGDALVSFDSEEQLLRVYSTAGKAIFQLDSLQMSTYTSVKK